MVKNTAKNQSIFLSQKKKKKKVFLLKLKLIWGATETGFV